MAKRDKFLDCILRGTSDANTAFADLRQLLKRLGLPSGFVAIITSSLKDGVEEILNLQPKGAQAKPYQVKQVRGVIVKYQLAGGDDEK